MKRKIIFLFILVIFFSINIFAFVTFPSAKLDVDKSEIKVGDVINAEVEISVPSFIILLQSEEDFSVEGWDIQDFSFVQDLMNVEKYKLKLVLTTFDNKLKEIPKIKFSYINKKDFEKDSFFCEKFYFFSNSVPVVVNSILDDYDKNGIFDIKNVKNLYIPFIFYVICLIVVLFVFFGIYKNIVFAKINEDFKIHLTPRENAIRKLNNIVKNDFDDSKISSYYYVLSEILKKFILESLNKNNIEFTSSELIALISLKDNIFYKYYGEISALFKIYDNAKYSKDLLDKEKFIKTYIETKNIIENIKIYVEKNNLETK